jgi:molybdopterin-guanine dinucleotide biosynthesis protein
LILFEKSWGIDPEDSSPPMTRAIYIVGNDGSGKTTYSKRLEKRLRRRGYSVTRQHYYHQRVRRALRSSVELVAGVSKRKTIDAGDRGAELREQHASHEHAARGGESSVRTSAGRLLIATLYAYQIAMALEMHLKLLFSRVDFLIIDRSYVDDLASILESFKQSTPASLVRFSSEIFPQRRIIYVSAGYEIEYARIEDVDLSESVHREKSQRYEEMVEVLASSGAPLRRVDTRPGSRISKPEISGVVE